MIRKIISGGQTGVDQGALDAAILLKIPHGGWIPRGRRTESGPLPDQYLLREMPTRGYRKRTEQNVIDSDGTLIISRGPLAGGSRLTRELAEKHQKPCFHADLSETPAFLMMPSIHKWIEDNDVRVLNVAGPRASDDPGIHRHAMLIVGGVLMRCLTAS